MSNAPHLQAFLDLYLGLLDFLTDQTAENLMGFGNDAALRRPKADMNHAVWLLGHMTWLADYLLAEVPHGRSFRERDWDRLFEGGSPRLPDDAYPPFETVKTAFAEVMRAVKDHVRALTPADLVKPCLARTDWFPTPVDSMLSFLRDANYHLGQLSYLRKLLA